MILPEFKELFAPYEKSGTTLEVIRAWMIKQSKQPEEIVDQSIAETNLGIGIL